MRILAKVINSVANSSIGKKLSNPVNAGSAAAMVATISCVTKDAVNCCYYVKQSLDNERIPEEKRKFVASLDLANGILNVVTQLIIGPAAEKFTGKMFDKYITTKYFSGDAISALQTNKACAGRVTSEFFKDIMGPGKTAARTGLLVLASLIGTQIIAKRVIVPFLATPMASYFKEKFEQNEKNKQGKTDSVDISFKNNQKTAELVRELPECFKQFK